MDSDRLIGAELTLALAATVAGDLLGQGPNKGLPGPRRILAMLGFYALLGWVAALGDQAARVAAGVGALVALLVLMGPGAVGFSQLLQRLAGFAATPAGAKPTPPAGSGSGSSPGGIVKSLWGAIESIIPGASLVVPAAKDIGGAVFGGSHGTEPAQDVGPRVRQAVK